MSEGVSERVELYERELCKCELCELLYARECNATDRGGMEQHAEMWGQTLGPAIDTGATSRPLIDSWIRFCGDAAGSLPTTSTISVILCLV